jgi:hypothetical protein
MTATILLFFHSKIFYHKLFQDVNVSGASVAAVSQGCTSTMLLLLIVEN